MSGMLLQQQIRRNALEFQSTLRDLSDWEQEVQSKDNGLRDGKITLSKKCKPIPVRGSRTQPQPAKPQPAKKEGTKSLADRSTEVPEESEGFQEEKCKGNELFKARRFKEAEACYTECIRLAPNNTLGYLNRAAARLKQDRFLDAKDDCTCVLKEEPENCKALYRRAQAYKGLELWKEAIADLDVIINARVGPNTKKSARVLRQSCRRAMEDAAATEEAMKQAKRKIVIEEVDSSSDEESDVDISAPVEQPRIDDTKSGAVAGTESSANLADQPTHTCDSTQEDTHQGAQPALSVTSMPMCSREEGTIRELNHGETDLILDMNAPEAPICPNPTFHAPANTRDSVVTVSAAQSKSLASPETAVTPESSEGPSEQEAATAEMPQESRVATAFDFESRYRTLRRGDPATLLAFFRAQPTSSYASLMKTCLDADFIHDFVETTHRTDSGLSVVDKVKMLEALTSVPRFELAALFLEDQDLSAIRGTISQAQTQVSKQSLEALTKAFCL